MMKIDDRKMTPMPKCRHHYLLSVHNSDWLRTEYHVEFLTEYGVMLADWYSPEHLRTAWMINFFDRQTLYSLHPRSRYDTYTAMHYSAKELRLCSFMESALFCNTWSTAEAAISFSE